MAWRIVALSLVLLSMVGLTAGQAGVPGSTGGRPQGEPAGASPASPTPPERAAACDFSFPQETQLSKIVDAIARAGRLNIVLAPAAANLKTSLDLRDVEPIAALHTVVQLFGLRCRQVGPSAAIRTPTFIVGPAQLLDGGEVVTRVVRIRHRAADELLANVRPTLDFLGLLKATSDRAINSIVLLGSQATVFRAGELLTSLDVPMASPTVNVKLLAGPRGHGETVWSGSVGLANGCSASIEASDTSSVPPTEGSTRVATVAMSVWAHGSVTDGFRLKVVADVRLVSNRTTSGTVKLQGETQLPVGEARSLASADVADLSLEVLVSLLDPRPKGARPAAQPSPQPGHASPAPPSATPSPQGAGR